MTVERFYVPENTHPIDIGDDVYVRNVVGYIPNLHGRVMYLPEVEWANVLLTDGRIILRKCIDLVPKSTLREDPRLKDFE